MRDRLSIYRILKPNVRQKSVLSYIVIFNCFRSRLFDFGIQNEHTDLQSKNDVIDKLGFSKLKQISIKQDIESGVLSSTST